MIRPLDSLSPSPDNYTRHMDSAMEAQTNKKQLKLGIVGIGVGASEILPAMEQMPEFKLVAAADINPRVLETFRQRYGAKTYDSIEKCAPTRTSRPYGSRHRTNSMRLIRSSPPTPASTSLSRSQWRSHSKKPSR